jgi:hypothetical protein
MIRTLLHIAALTALLVCVAALLAGCPRMPAPDGCTPRAARCSAGGVPEVCSQTGRWTPADRPCADLRAVCCATTSAYGGRAVYACVPASACLPPDGGAL